MDASAIDQHSACPHCPDEAHQAKSPSCCAQVKTGQHHFNVWIASSYSTGAGYRVRHTTRWRLFDSPQGISRGEPRSNLCVDVIRVC